jgi:glycosyltransferase involved in cell wall biosynthesis
MARRPALFKNADRPWAPPFPDPAASRALREVVEAEKPDIVHGHDWLARSFLPLKRQSGARLVISLHYYTRSCAKKSLMRQNAPCAGPGPLRCLLCSAGHYGLAKGPAVAATNWLAGGAEGQAVDAYIAVSRATADGNGLAAGEERLRLIPNFLPPAETAGIDVESYLARLPREPFLLFVGDLRPDKGIDVLLAAYARLRGAPPLVLIGKRWPESPAAMPANVHFLEKWPNAAVRAAWQRAEIGVVPSVWPEPFGIVVIEALAAGTPVVASRAGGIPEIIGDGREGLLVPPGEPGPLADALERLLADPALRTCMSLAARARARRYTAEAVVPQIERVYLDLLERQDPPSRAWHLPQNARH